MKFYIISIILNIGILFIPIFTLLKDTEEKQEVITVNLQNMSFENNDNAINTGQEDPEQKNKEINSSKSEIIQDINRITENSDIKKNIETVKKTQKTENRNIVNPAENRQTAVNNNNNHQSNNDGQLSSGNSVSDKNTSSGDTGKVTDNGASTNGNSNRQHNNSSKDAGNNNDGGKEKVTNVCREGIDFTVTYNPNLQYPVAAERLGLRNTVVINVKLNFNSNGSVSIIGISGGNNIFRDEARRAASGIRVKIKNPETLKCTITKPFRFNPR